MCGVLLHCWSCSSTQMLQSVIYLSRWCQFLCCFYLQTIGNQWCVSTLLWITLIVLSVKAAFVCLCLGTRWAILSQMRCLDFWRHFRSNLPVFEDPFFFFLCNIIFSHNFFIIRSRVPKETNIKHLFFCSDGELICTKTD